MRYVDWRVYGRTGRLYTRLYQAERNIALHVVLDTSRSMSKGHKARFARILAQLLSYAAQRDSVSQVHLFDGRQNRPTQGRGRVGEVWNFIEAASEAPADRTPPATALKTFALTTQFPAGAGLALIISDLLDEASWQPALAALKARGLDAGFLQIMAVEDLEPEPGQLELEDLETGEKLLVGPEEVRAYHRAVHGLHRPHQARGAARRLSPHAPQSRRRARRGVGAARLCRTHPGGDFGQALSEGRLEYDGGCFVLTGRENYP